MSIGKHMGTASLMATWLRSWTAHLEGKAFPLALPKGYFGDSRRLVERFALELETGASETPEDLDILRGCLPEELRKLKDSELAAQLKNWLTVLDTLQPGDVSKASEMSGAIRAMHHFFLRLGNEAQGENNAKREEEGHRGLEPEGYE